MRVAELWRYPVKSMAGEPLDAVEVRLDGVLGDRLVRVEDGEGRVVTARTRPRLLGHRGTLAPDGEPRVDGRPWRGEDVAREVIAAAGKGARLVRVSGAEDRFDVLPLLVATDGAIAALGYDRRRFRPNILVAGVEGHAERDWPGRFLRVRGCVIAVARLRPRCVMTTFDPDTLAQDVGVLRRIARELDGSFALDCSVVREGTIHVGDGVELLDAPPG
ncbi:MAG TPA: MOSC N-terminal beta barrel domain-containing protein [Anaeromyxobacter sp.]